MYRRGRGCRRDPAKLPFAIKNTTIPRPEVSEETRGQVEATPWASWALSSSSTPRKANTGYELEAFANDGYNTPCP